MRAGRELSLNKYNEVNLQEKSSLVQIILDKVVELSQMDYTLESVVELKYWSFPNSTLYLLRCENSNKSSTYFSLLNSSEFILMGHNYVPRIVSNIPVEYQLANFILRQFLMRTVDTKNLMFSTYESIHQINFFEIYFDPTYKEFAHVNINYKLKNESNYTRLMGALFKYYDHTHDYPFGYGVKNASKLALWMD